MAISFVATATNFGTGTSQTCAFAPNPTTGNGLICCIGTADATSTISSIFDTYTNNWLPIGSSVGNGFSTFFYYVKQGKAGSGTNTVSVAVNTSGSFIELNLFELAPGAGATSILFDLFTGGADPANPTMGPTPTLSVASEFALAYAVVSNSVGTISTAGWTQVNLAPTTDDLLGYQITTATTPLSITWTYGGSPAYAGAIVTFKSSSAGGVTQQATVAIASKATMTKNIASVLTKPKDTIAAKGSIFSAAALVIHKANVTI